MNEKISIGNNLDLGGAIFYLILAYFIGRYYRNRRYPAAMRYRTTMPRFWAGLVDQAVLFPSKLLLALATPWLPLYLIALFEIALSTAYSILLHAHYGQTVGKWVCKIKIVDHLTATQISLNQAFLRDSGLLVGLLYAASVLKGEEFDPNQLTGTAALVAGTWFILEIISMLLNKKRRALHDLLAGTVVIRTNTEPDDLPATRTPIHDDTGALNPPEGSF